MSAITSTQIKRLYRSRSERMIGGVCGGVGQFLGIDPTLIRLLFIFAALFVGQGLLAYLIMLLIIPEEPLGQSAVASQNPSSTAAEPAVTEDVKTEVKG